MKNKKFSVISSILSYIDDNYISDEVTDNLCSLDINEVNDQTLILTTVVKPEFDTWDATSKQNLASSLIELISLSESDVEDVLSMHSFSTVGNINHKIDFLSNLKIVLQL